MRQWAPRVLEAAAWISAATLLAISATQWFSNDSRILVAVAQAFTPWLLLLGPLVVGIPAGLTRRRWLAAAVCPALITGMVIAAPIVMHPSPGATTGDEPTLSIFFANALFSNQTPTAAATAIEAVHADVIVLAEFTPELRSELDTLVGTEYPYRVEQPAPAPSSNGIALWSTVPFDASGVIDVAGRPTADALFRLGGVPVRLLGVHTAPPTHDAGYWGDQLRAIGAAADGSDVRTVVIGDFNGSRWHPSFRWLLDRGFTDAHEALGNGWSVSWPTDEGWFPPPFVRLDHALYRHGLSPLGVRDIDVPGSDHRGFVVTFAVIGS